MRICQSSPSGMFETKSNIRPLVSPRSTVSSSRWPFWYVPPVLHAARQAANRKTATTRTDQVIAPGGRHAAQRITRADMAAVCAPRQARRNHPDRRADGAGYPPNSGVRGDPADGAVAVDPAGEG